MIEVLSVKVIVEFVDNVTGEVFSEERILGEGTKKTTAKRAKKPKDDGELVPMIHVLDGKWQLNQKAIELTGYQPEDKLDIQFEKQGRTVTPVLLQDEARGNRLTKSYTVSCRGQKRENLIQYGTCFELEPYKDLMFKLKGNIEQAEDDVIDIPEELENIDELENDALNPDDFSLE